MDEGALQLHEGALQLQDNADHVVRIASSEISCVRIGHFDAKYRSYHLRIWRDIDEKPFEPILVKQSWAAYRETITEFAGVFKREPPGPRRTRHIKIRCAGRSRINARTHTRRTRTRAVVLTDEPWWERMIISVAPIIVLTIMIRLGFKRYWPRPVCDLSELEQQLPSG